MKRLFLVAMLAIIAIVPACAKSGKNHKDIQAHGAHGEAAANKDMGDTTEAVWKFSSEIPQAGVDTLVTINILDEKGQAVEKFDLNHEKKLHLIMVSEDLSYFNHIHPEYKSKGQFEIRTTFPAGGTYKLFADYVPTGGSAVTKSQAIKVSGSPAAPVPIVPDKALTRTVDGKTVTLSIDHLMAGMEAKLTFRIMDAATKQPITDLQPYLGAVGHVVVLSADMERYLHVHPIDELAKGPDAEFMTSFPSSGIYKIWGQFQQKDKVFLVPFVVQVP